jgi:predicted nucleotidyltransferase
MVLGDSMDCHIPKVIQPILIDYVELLMKELSNRIEGVFLYGSIALGTSDSLSDIDFVTVINNHLTRSEKTILIRIHDEISKKYSGHIMDGGYLRWEDIGCNEPEPSAFYNGKGIGHGFYNQTPVTWWILKHYGVTVFGDGEQLQKLKVTSKQLIQYVRQNMKSYWVHRLDKLKLMDTSTLKSSELDEEIEWSVLGVARQFFTLRENDIISKVGAGDYIMLNLPEHSRIVKEAIRIRKKSASTTYFSKLIG